VILPLAARARHEKIRVLPHHARAAFSTA